MHAVGVVLGLIGAVAIVTVALEAQRIEVAPILIYVVGLLAMLALSAAYNMWPITPTKWILRRFDHSAIYLLIAGTYTPFLALMKSSLLSAGLGIGVWASALVGMALKLVLPGRFDRFAIVLCLALGWSGAVAYDFDHFRLAEPKPVAARNRRHSLLDRHPFPRLAKPALSECYLACIRAACGKLSLLGSAHLPDLGVTTIDKKCLY